MSYGCYLKQKREMLEEENSLEKNVELCGSETGWCSS